MEILKVAACAKSEYKQSYEVQAQNVINAHAAVFFLHKLKKVDFYKKAIDK